MKRRYDALMFRTWRVDDPRQVMALIEEAIVIADRYLTESDAHRARMRYTEKAVEFGEYDKMIVSFAWCWTKFTEHPDRYSSFMLLWHFKWVVENLWKSTVYSLEQLERLLEMFREQSAKFNYSLRPYYEARMHLMLHTGRMDEADEYYRLWRKEKRDGLSNCQACEQHAMGGYYFDKGHYKRGLQLLKPIMEGKLTCRDVPAVTHERVVSPYLALGRPEEARVFADKAWRAFKGESGKLYQFGNLMAFYAVTNRRRALQICRNTWKHAETTANDWGKLHYLVGAQFLLEQAGIVPGRKRKDASLPDPGWVSAEIGRLAKAFDERNRNTFVSRKIDELRRQYAKWTEMAAADGR